MFLHIVAQLLKRHVQSTTVGRTNCLRFIHCTRQLAASVQEIQKLFSERFHPKLVGRLHRLDCLDGRQWKLIYRDVGLRRLLLGAAFLMPVFALISDPNAVSTIAGGQVRLALENIQLVEQLGPWAILPLGTFLLMVAVIWRMNFLRPSRLYVNVAEPNRLVAVVARYGFLQKQMHFTIDEVRMDKAADAPNPLGAIINGTATIGKRRCLLNEDGFRENKYQAYLHRQLVTLAKPSSANVQASRAKSGE